VCVNKHKFVQCMTSDLWLPSYVYGQVKFFFKAKVLIDAIIPAGTNGA